MCDQSVYTCARVVLLCSDVIWSIGPGRMIDSPVQGRGVNSHVLDTLNLSAKELSVDAVLL